MIVNRRRASSRTNNLLPTATAQEDKARISIDTASDTDCLKLYTCRKLSHLPGKLDKCSCSKWPLISLLPPVSASFSSSCLWFKGPDQISEAIFVPILKLSRSTLFQTDNISCFPSFIVCKSPVGKHCLQLLCLLFPNHKWGKLIATGLGWSWFVANCNPYCHAYLLLISKKRNITGVTHDITNSPFCCGENVRVHISTEQQGFFSKKRGTDQARIYRGSEDGVVGSALLYRKCLQKRMLVNG